MRCFQIDGLTITAQTKEQADSISRELGSSRANRIIFAYDDGTVQMISLKDQSCVVFSQSGASVTQIGRLVSGTGQKIIQAAVDNIDKTDQHGAKLRRKQKQIKRLVREEEYNAIISAFEAKVPERAQKLFQGIVAHMCQDNLAYRVEMYQQIDESVQVVPENWLSILQWFNANVLASNDRTFFAQRKAFVTTVIKMGPQEHRVGNTVQGAAENDGDFWSKYAREELGGSNQDSP